MVKSLKVEAGVVVEVAVRIKNVQKFENENTEKKFILFVEMQAPE